MTMTLTEAPIIDEPAEPAHVIKWLDHTGDSRLAWDPRNPAETEAAEAHFNSLKGKGYLAYRLGDDGRYQGEAIRTFDPQAATIMMTPPMQAG